MVEEVHCCRVAKHVWRDTLLFQRRAVQAGRAHVLGQKVLHCVAAERSASDIRKEGIGWWAILFEQPSPQHRHDLLAKRRATVLPSLALAPDVRPSAEDDILAAKPHQLRDSQPRLHGEEKERPIATADPGPLIGRGHEGVDLGATQEFNS